MYLMKQSPADSLNPRRFSHKRKETRSYQGKQEFPLVANLAAMKLLSLADQAAKNRGLIAWKMLLLKRKCPTIVCDPIFITSSTKEIHDVFQ